MKCTLAIAILAFGCVVVFTEAIPRREDTDDDVLRDGEFGEIEMDEGLEPLDESDPKGPLLNGGKHYGLGRGLRGKMLVMRMGGIIYPVRRLGLGLGLGKGLGLGRLGLGIGGPLGIGLHGRRYKK